MHRHTDEWVLGVRDHGRWDLPEPWPNEERTLMPWSDDELTAALDALRELYPHKIARRIFRDCPLATDPKPSLARSRKIAMMLQEDCFWRHSALLDLGLDAAAIDSARLAPLKARLACDEDFPGARFELSVMAAMERENVDWSFESAHTEIGKLPDFRVRLPHELLIDAKAARVSQRVKRDRSWFDELMWSQPRFHPKRCPLEAHVDLHQEITRLDELARAELIPRVWALVASLHEAGIYPATGEIDDLVTVTVDERRCSSLSPVHDYDDEARRIVRGLVHDKAVQLAGATPGAFLVDLGDDGRYCLKACMDEVGRWMRQEGADYKHVEHVFLTTMIFHEHRPLICVAPISRKRTPTDVVQFCNSLVRGLNFVAIRNAERTDSVIELPTWTDDADLPGADESV